MNWLSKLLPTTKKNEDDDNLHSMSDVVRGIQHSVNTAAQSTERHFLRNFDTFFDVEGEGPGALITPKMLRIKTGDGHYMDVPLMSLIPQSGLKLDEMEVEMSIEIKQSAVKKNESDKDGKNTPDRSSFKVVPAPAGKSSRSNLVKVKMKFKSGETPEGIERTIENLTNLIEAKPIEDLNKNKANATEDDGDITETENG